ncbi:DUF2513 domain-containing protein [Pseudomonas sp. MM213]|uniref:DUF2513 domain-containing protein n=1 Tax=Pseudomonas sp. MM213 TaxID=2866807 RepID=UPI001CF19D43|nr:DUF2513 domain-containing protein [Pseudomonas sp. MM213]UCP10265.1 DUF2513 domain-containing protein [Pseudomonas sp. MM213]
MKRDMDLIRQIILTLEEYPLRPGGIVSFDVFKGDFPVENYSNDEIYYHVRQIKMTGLIENISGPMSGFAFRGLTPAGHDFAESVRSDEIWAMTKDGALKAGGFTVGLLVDLAKGLVKKQIEKHTGIEL